MGMVFPMIAEMVTCEKRPKHGVIVALRAMFVAIAARGLAMRQISSKIKKLQCAQQSGAGPKEEQIGNGDMQQMVHEIER